nr:MAG TPA: hypothetical protein [Caudoviricetes sp.]
MFLVSSNFTHRNAYYSVVLEQINLLLTIKLQNYE